MGSEVSSMFIRDNRHGVCCFALAAFLSCISFMTAAMLVYPLPYSELTLLDDSD